MLSKMNKERLIRWLHKGVSADTAIVKHTLKDVVCFREPELYVVGHIPFLRETGCLLSQTFTPWSSFYCTTLHSLLRFVYRGRVQSTFRQRAFLPRLTVHLCLTFIKLSLLHTSKMAYILLHLFGFDSSNLFRVEGNKTVKILCAGVAFLKPQIIFLLFLSRYSRVSRKHQELQSSSSCRSQCESHIKVSTVHSCLIALTPQWRISFILLAL